MRADTVPRSVSCCGAAVAGNGGPGIQTVKSGLTLIVASRTRSLNGRYGDVFDERLSFTVSGSNSPRIVCVQCFVGVMINRAKFVVGV